MAKSYDKLVPYDKDGELQVVVETPRGSAIKFDYDPKHAIFKVSRPLPLGVTFPFDFGFVPGTLAPDGDPVDALVLNELPTFPGILICCRLLGMVEMTERTGKGKKKRETNNRLLVRPDWSGGQLEEAGELTKAVRHEIEHFFVSTGFATGKEVKITGWCGPKKAAAYVDAHTV
ncbi:MAG: inorganic diphosphatase [Gammaproteobacteria bacterium]|nr:inorganic diphosphatase [Gammaproteobacteria bacterium]MBV9698471.1 inorganic diphosphatase [Gammaproteobacteria bacterium]